MEYKRRDGPRGGTTTRNVWPPRVLGLGTTHLVVPLLDGQRVGDGKPIAMDLEVGRLAGGSQRAHPPARRLGRRTRRAARAASGRWRGQHTGPAMETAPSRRRRDLASGEVSAGGETATEIVATPQTVSWSACSSCVPAKGKSRLARQFDGLYTVQQRPPESSYWLDCSSTSSPARRIPIAWNCIFIFASSLLIGRPLAAAWHRVNRRPSTAAARNMERLKLSA
jgi:hypothetical protein